MPSFSSHGPTLKIVQAPLDGVPSFYFVNCTTLDGLSGKLAKGVFGPTVYFIDKEALVPS